MSEDAQNRIEIMEKRMSEITINRNDTVQIKDIFKILSDRRYLKIVPMIFVSAICISANSGILVPLMT